VITENTIKQREYKLLILSFFLLNIYLWISTVEDIYGIPKIVKYAISIFVLGTIIYFKILNPTKPSPGGLFYPLIIVFFLWSLIVLVSASLKFNNIFYLQRILAQPYFFIPYVLPIILLFTKFDLDFFCNVFYYSSLLIVPAILIQLFIIVVGISSANWEEQASRIGIFDIGISFVLLSAQMSRKKNIFNLSLVFTMLMLFLYFQFGRRGMLIEYALLLLFMIFIRLRSNFLNFNDRMKIYFMGIILSTMILAFGYLAKSSYAFERGGFTKEAFEESRGAVFYDFFFDFNSVSDWIFGRGLEGRVLRSINLEVGYSDVIENGALTVVLKGGLLYLIPFILILLRASYLGFTNSKNDLTKALASLQIVYVLGMLYFNLPSFTTAYIFIWISASACLTPELRNIRNEEIYQALDSRFK
jgi:hypothetical protein